MNDRSFDLPPDKEAILQKAVRLEWWTIAYLVSAVVAIYLTLGASQAMKATWMEDLLSLVPPIAFLIATRIRFKDADDEYPYGYHRAVSVAYLVASLALLFMGFYILYDSVVKLISFEHPPIGLVQPFGDPVWLGWFMYPALVWSAIPAVFLGRAKIPLAKELHDKVLYADAEMNKADWMTATAAMIGVTGIFFGIWWLDAAAAIFISLDIAFDGARNTRGAMASLMDRRPTLADESGTDPLPARLKTELEKMPWVERAQVRLREEGHVYMGDAEVVPSDQSNLVARIEEAKRTLLALDWRLHDIAITPLRELTEEAGLPEKAGGAAE